MTTPSPSTNFAFLASFKPTRNSKPLFQNPRNRFSVRCFRPPETDPLPEVQKFWGWASDKGIVSVKCPVKPGNFPEGLGLIAQKDIARNEVVLEVPKKFWINPDTVAASQIGSEEELSELQGSQLLNTTLGVKELVENEFAKLEEDVIIPNKRLFPFDITLNDFFWAFGILRSRAFTRLEGQSLVLIPLADLINHSPDIIAQANSWEVRGAGLFSRELLFSLKSPIAVKAGDQVMIQYDLNKSNAELALDYGFIESRSERNAYTLTLEIPESDPFFGDKLDIAESNGLGETAYFDIVLGQPLPATMLPYLRLLALGGGDAFLLESIFRNSIWGHLELPVSPANEEFICQVIRNACRSALSGYNTTIKEDEKLIVQGDLNPRQEIAVGIRLGEKKVLQQIDEIFKEREMELGGYEYYQERRLKDLGLAGAQGEKLPWIGEV